MAWPQTLQAGRLNHYGGVILRYIRGFLIITLLIVSKRHREKWSAATSLLSETCDAFEAGNGERPPSRTAENQNFGCCSTMSTNTAMPGIGNAVISVGIKAARDSGRATPVPVDRAASLPGGPRVLQMARFNPFDWVSAIPRGFPSQSLDSFATNLGATDSELGEMSCGHRCGP